MRRNLLSRLTTLEEKMAPEPNAFLAFYDHLLSSVSFDDYATALAIENVPAGDRTEVQRELVERVGRIVEEVYSHYTIIELEKIVADCPPAD
jgi:hypothetical protein